MEVLPAVFKMNKTNDVIALGNALMDFLVEIDEDKLLGMDLRKGEMHLIEEEQAKRILKKLKTHKLNIELVPGGSASNTLRCLGLLGANVILCGKVGNDHHGEIYIEEIKNHHVLPRINTSPKVTGHAITFITPDAERTFSVHLGASIELATDDILEEDIASSKILLLEGYQLEGKTKETVFHAAALAKKYRTLIAFDLSDGGVIRRNETLIHDFVKKYVDILFANELEARDYTGLTEKEAAQRLGQEAAIAIVKVGERGSFIHANGRLMEIHAAPARAIDTTGAGDTFAAGFLYGYCHGWPLEKSGTLGSMLAAKIVETKGVKFVRKDLERIRDLFSS